MKNIKSIVAGLIIASAVIMLSSCDVTKVSDVTFQYTISMKPNFSNRTVPDSSYTLKDLTEEKEYNENKEDIESAEILHFNYNIIDYSVNQKIPLDSIIFEEVSFYYIPTDKDGDVIDGTEYLLGKFTDLKVKDYIKTAQHIIAVSDNVGKLITDQLDVSPKFVFITKYSKLKGYENVRFNYIDAQIDMVLRVTTK